MPATSDSCRATVLENSQLRRCQIGRLPLAAQSELCVVLRRLLAQVVAGDRRACQGILNITRPHT